MENNCRSRGRTTPVILAALAIVLAVLSAAPAWSGDPAASLAFADHLYQQGDYYRAVTEYERVLFLHPGTREAATARFQIAQCYFQSEKYGQAIERYRSLIIDMAADPLAEQAQLMLAEAYYRRGDYMLAIEAAETFLAAYPASPRRDAAQIRLGWSHLRQGSWTRAAGEFKKLPPDSPLARQGADLAGEAERFPELPRKSPLVAGTLAILPGAGHLYVGRPGEAAGALVLNGLFIWGAVRTNEHGNHVAAGILAFFELGWYIGNIQTAITAAEAYNRRSEKTYFDRLDAQYALKLGASDRGVPVALLQLRF